MRHSRTASRQRGFTLIEMSIVLIIFGILVGGGLLAMNPLLDRARVRQTQANMDQIEDALLLYVMRFQRLPCPAVGSQTANAGQEGLSGSNCSAASTADGVVPWVTLGLPEAATLDGWNRRISYFAAPGAISTNALKRASITSFPELGDADGAIVENVQGNDLTVATDRPAYVLVSHGKNGFGAFPVGATQRTQGAAGAEDENADGDNRFVEDAGDDIVRWRQPSFLSHRCGPPCAP